MSAVIKYYKDLGKLDDEDPNSPDLHAFHSSSPESYHSMAWKTLKGRAMNKKETIIAKKDGKEIARHEFKEDVDLLEGMNKDQQPFSNEMIKMLHAHYSTIKGIDPSSDTYKRLIKSLDGMSQGQLKQLRDNKVPWLGKLAHNRIVKEDVEELDEAQKFQSITHMYGLRHKEFGGRDKRLKTVETWHKTSEARAKFAEKLENKDGFYGIDGYHDPLRSVKEESELDEMTSFVGKAVKDGDLHHIWQMAKGSYEIQNRKTGKKDQHNGTLDQLERKGYSWVKEETELDESGFDYSYFAKMQAAKNRESLAKQKAEDDERKRHAAGMKRYLSGGSYMGGPRPPKEINTTDHKLHKAFEKYLGGTFEHFESTPKHLTVKENGKTYPAIHTHVTHSYTHKDLGMLPGEMEDTAETHPVTAIRKEGKYEIIHGHYRSVSEEVKILDEISKTTLSSYVIKASKDAVDNGRDAMANGIFKYMKSPLYDKDDAIKSRRVTKNRLAGIETAVKKITKEEVELDESVFTVMHDGVSSDHTDAELVRLFANKKNNINHVTKYPKSAWDTAAMLRKKGFKNVRIEKDGKPMNEETELDENILASISNRKTVMLKKAKTSAAKVAIYGAKDHVELDAVKKRHSIEEEVLDEADNYKVPGKKMTGRGGNPSNAVERAAVKKGILPDGEENRKYNKHYLGAAAALSTRQQKSLEKGKPAVGRLEKIYKERTDPDYRYEEVELDEGKMSEIHQDLQDHLDKHIATFKKMGGAEALMGHADSAAKKIAKAHGIEHVHAKKFASDYIDSALKEEVEELDEVSGKLLGSYIQKARAQDAEKRQHAKELDDDSKVKEYNDKIYALYKEKSYTRSGANRNHSKINTLRDKILTRKQKLDPEYPKSAIPTRHSGIDQAIRKLQSGKLTNEEVEGLDEGISGASKDYYEFVHGKRPSGKAYGWMFSTVHPKRHSWAKHEKDTYTHSGESTFTDASKAAVAHFKSKGHSGDVHVLT